MVVFKGNWKILPAAHKPSAFVMIVSTFDNFMFCTCIKKYYSNSYLSAPRKGQYNANGMGARHW